MGTGPNSRIIAADVNEFTAQPQAKPAASAAPKASQPTTQVASDFPADMFKDIETSNIRRIIA